MERGQGQVGVSDRPLSDFLPCDSELSEDVREVLDVRLLPSFLNKSDHFSTDEHIEPPCA